MQLKLYTIKRKRMRNLIKSLVLFWVAGILSVILLPLGIIWTVGEILVRIFSSSQKKSAFSKSLWFLTATLHSLALWLDQIGNAVCRDMFNRLLIEEDGYKFGKVQETISSVLGKNQETWTLTLVGRAVVGILDWLDKDHCRESIVTFTSLEHKKDEWN